MNRRKFFQAAVLASSVPLLLTVRAEDWPKWRGLNRDGVWNEAGIMESFPTGGLKIAWRASVGPGVQSRRGPGPGLRHRRRTGASHSQGARALF